MVHPGFALPEEIEAMGEPFCPTVLSVPITRPRCEDFRALRQWVLCRAHRLIMEPPAGKPLGFSAALKQAWAEAKLQCAQIGARAEEEPGEARAMLVVPAGTERPIGSVTLDKKGVVGLCLGDTCVQSRAEEEALLPITIGLLQGFGLGVREEP